jgi:hypothetical protein
MKKIFGIIIVTVFCSTYLSAADKTWNPPSYKMYTQTLTEKVMASHPELISATFHGPVPGKTKVYTMFGGSYIDRIGNADDDDDIMVIEKGITILDPRWHKTHDPIQKYVVQLPLRNSAGENIGLFVLAYHRNNNSTQTDRDYLDSATSIRDTIAQEIPSYDALFAPAK